MQLQCIREHACITCNIYTAQRGCVDLVNDKLFLVNINLIVVLLYLETFLKMLITLLYHHQKRSSRARVCVCMYVLCAWCIPAWSTTTRHSFYTI